ncbi:Piwi-domain-containing protein [Trametes sanguinea]|nr:Piwi-domain-containing protein [Trametes sanguinea]
MSLNLLQLIVRQAPNMRHKFPADARSFFIAHNARDLRRGISAWRGYFQSVRPVLGKLIINVDVSHAAVYTPGRLIDTMMAYLGFSDVRKLADLEQLEYIKLRVFLKGVRIKPILSKMKPRPISDLVLAAGMQEFDKDGERCTVTRHFEQKYNVTVRFPRLVGIKVGQGSIIPAEFCEVVPGQIYRKKIPVECQNDFLQFSTQKPADRLRDIQNAVAGPLFDYPTSDFMKEAGMKVDTRAMSIAGNVLSPPAIRYQNDRVQPGQGKWNVVRKQFIQPATLRFWGVAVFDRVPDSLVQGFVTKLVGNMERAGLTVTNKYPPIHTGNQQDMERTLHNVGNECIDKRFIPPNWPRDRRPVPQLILVILPANAADCRRMVKHWGDIKMNVATQCVRGGKWQKASDQYCNNVILKINSRLGGVNSVLESQAASFLQQQPSMIVGADVGHPGPGSASRPSVTGLVASVDAAVSKLTSYANVQRPRLEIIEDLEGMMMNALRDYRDYQARNVTPNPPPPRNIIFYRDGVSEGEFAQIAEREIPLIRSAFEKSKIPAHLTPKLLFIVVGKSPQQADNSGNCPAGLLVDQHITNPNYTDFYLQSHAGILGTSRPSHYIILANETSLGPKEVQELTFNLCHTYVSATRSVSIPAPVYYADRVCARMEFHCANGATLDDSASNVTGAEDFNLEYWKTAFKQSGLNRNMYFL